MCRPVHIVLLGIKPGDIVFPSQNNNMVQCSFSVLQAMWELDIFSSALGLLWWPVASVVLTICFPITRLGYVWETVPSPPAVRALVRLFNPTFWAWPSDTVTLSHGLVVGTYGSHPSTPSSPMTSSPSATASLVPRVSVFPFFNCGAFLWRAAFGPSSASI
jgi:hypothetical protein